MRFIRSAAFFLTLVVCTLARAAEPATTIDLNGAWFFALDPLDNGAALGWHSPPDDWDGASEAPAPQWDRVTAPHSWTLDPRYQHFGKAWYRRSVLVPDSGEPDRHYRLRFGAVYHRCRVFVNGTEIGSHVGGYTPFELDATDAIVPGRHNLIAIEVDNSWNRHTIPGSRPGNTPDRQLFPWWPSGGLTGDIALIVQGPARISTQWIQTDVDLDAGTVIVRTHANLHNDGKHDITGTLRFTIADTEQPETVLYTAEQSITLPTRASREQAGAWRLALDDLQLWDLDNPELYTCTAELIDTNDNVLARHTDRFGVRTFTIDGTRLLLNGKPIRLAGANRAFDHPTGATMDPPEVVEQDGRLLKEASLEFSRLQHQPLSTRMLDWADEHGLLIIQEAGSWGFPAEHLADPVVREVYKKQLRATVEMSRNHPSVVGWSVGNEYESWTPEGVAWTRDMKQFLRDDLGEQRPIVFVAIGRAGRVHLASLQEDPNYNPSTSSFAYSDILCINWYGNASHCEPIIDALHASWPDRPMLITEFGARVDRSNPDERAAQLRDYANMVRQRDHIACLSYWSFNDYRSMYPATNPNGVRPWGLVEYDRTPRPLYEVARTEFAPLTLDTAVHGSTLRITLQGRSDFPSRTLQRLSVRITPSSGDASNTVFTHDIAQLTPGEHITIDVPLPADDHDVDVIVRNAGGFVLLRHTIHR